MNKNAIQRYAIWARNELVEQVKQRAYQYGISEAGYGDENAMVIAGRVLSEDERQQRSDFIYEIQKHGYQEAVEEVAYTWFNRFIALRYMEVNNYLPTHIRVFSDGSGEFNPEILKNVLYLDLPRLDKAKVSALLNANKTAELYRYLLLTQCNALNAALPEMFEKLGTYTEMLLPDNILKQDSVLARLVKDIDEDDWKDTVQIIGWMYQYYNTEPKQAVFDGLKKNVKITKEKIPAATQLFTPDWIVRYMVENSLGRLWLETHPNPALKGNWKYYLDEAEQTPEVAEKLRVLRSQSPVKSPEDIRLIDPCMGSGHILVYAFDVLMQIYESEGYNPRDTAKLILEKNIYGLDIDCRAYQLAYFSLMMKARQYNRRIFTEDVKPQVYHPVGFPDGEEYGSLVKIDKLEPMPELPKEKHRALFDGGYDAKLNVWNFKRLLAQKYDVVVTNPPYMGSSGMGAKMSEFLKKNYPDSKSDLFSAFIERGLDWIKPTGYNCMVTMQSWMFLSSFETMRKKLLSTRTITNLLHMENMVMGIAFGTAVANLYGQHIVDYKGQYNYMTMKDIDDDKPIVFPTAHKRNCTASTENFEKIPGCPVAYWVGEALLKAFDNGEVLKRKGDTRQGMATSDNNRFLRLWSEVFFDKVGIGCKNANDALAMARKWSPYNKGGEFRKWYGNIDFVINYENDGYEVKKYARSLYNSVTRTIKSISEYFKPCLSWSKVSSGSIAFRFYPAGFVFDVAGCCVFYNDNEAMLYDVGFLNSIVSKSILATISPTLNYEAGQIASLPIIRDRGKLFTVNELTKSNINLSRTDWDSYETSWDFKRHPLICGERTVAAAFVKWEHEAAERFFTLKQNEEELNRIFIDLYGLQDELTPEVEDKDVTLKTNTAYRYKKQKKKESNGDEFEEQEEIVEAEDIRRERFLHDSICELISYAVGCMFGRYSLDVEGLAYGGGDWDSSKYKTFLPDKDNILPLCDDDYFDDDILGRFVDFIRKVYGEDTLEENLKFIAHALGGKGTPREVIRGYFLNGFYADHCKAYQKRPIYWLFDSGKKNGFKALTYLHRYSRDLLAKLRTDYVHEQQERYRTQLSHIAATLNTATGAERARLIKQQNKLSEQLKEITAFEERVHHLADQNIAIDLDDGVKRNYEIFKDVLAKI